MGTILHLRGRPLAGMLNHGSRMSSNAVGSKTFQRLSQQVLNRSSGCRSLRTPQRHPNFSRPVSYEQAAKDLNQQGIDDQMSEYNEGLSGGENKQSRAPWHREGVDTAPVNRQRSGGAMTKGKLLTTPSRLLKLVLPLTKLDSNVEGENNAPLALLVHPQQPLSYLERLIQSELPSITTEKGENRVPSVTFRAKEAKEDKIVPSKKSAADEEAAAVDEGDEEIADRDKSSGKKLGDGGVESYSGAGREGKGKDEGDFVKWSASTEIGDFIRDAARAKEFEVDIEGGSEPIKIGVPSFNDRTFYLRQRLRKISKNIADMATLKQECDLLAHRAGQRLAVSGCGILVAYWYVVYRLTFETDLGWDVMEPVTYLVGLSTLIGGYMWFLYHNREVSYRSALNLTISKRQGKLYEQRGFDLPKWEGLIEEGNAVRKEIKAVASEYDVEWDERADEHDKAVTKALRDERKSGQKKKSSKSKDEDEEEDE